RTAAHRGDQGCGGAGRQRCSARHHGLKLRLWSGRSEPSALLRAAAPKGGSGRIAGSTVPVGGAAVPSSPFVPEGAKLTASDGTPGDRFGWQVAMSGTTEVVGAFAGNGRGAG